MNEKHTPTPWDQKPQSTGQAQIYGANGKTIAITYYNDADAELIVRAVNSHDGLIAENALKSAVINQLAKQNEALVKAAKEATEVLHFLMQKPGHEFAANAVYHLNTAIAQAEGRP